MTQTQMHNVLKSFDPLATHPFTNNSGLMAKPTPPSQYPRPLPSSTNSASVTSSHYSSSAPSQQPPPPVRSPQPRRSPAKQSAGLGPIFVPFRPDRSSPDLDDILLKKKVSDVFSNKQKWCIDQTTVTSGGRAFAGKPQ